MHLSRNPVPIGVINPHVAYHTDLTQSGSTVYVKSYGTAELAAAMLCHTDHAARIVSPDFTFTGCARRSAPAPEPIRAEPARSWPWLDRISPSPCRAPADPTTGYLPHLTLAHPPPPSLPPSPPPCGMAGRTMRSLPMR